MFAELYRKLFPKKQLQVKSASVQSRHDTMVECLTYCEEMLGKKFSIRAAQVVQVESVVPNILGMIKELQRLNAILSKGNRIGPTDAIFTWRKMTLSDFFIDSNTGNYISQAAYRDFHAQATLFSNLTKEGSIAEYGVHEHNYRALASVTLTIIKICQAIDKAHHMAQ